MLIIHGFAKAKLYDLESNKIISVNITDRSGKNKIDLPLELYEHLLKKMNKYFRHPLIKPTDIWGQPEYETVKQVSFTYGEYDEYAVISVKSPSDEYSKAIGTSIVAGRLKRANGELITKGALRKRYKRLPDYMCYLI